MPDDAAEKLLGLLEAAPKTNAETLAWLGDVLKASEMGSQAVADLRAIVDYSGAGPAAGRLRVDPYLARGLSYYTGAIFEVEFPGLSGSGGGGGRYDELIGMFSGKSLPACGFSLGLERVILLMEERGMFPVQLAGQPQVLVTIFDESTVSASMALATQLRAAGLRVDLHPDHGRYGRQFQYAESRGIRYALILGPREIEAQMVAIKDLESGEQVAVPLAETAAWLLDRFG